ncbi:adenosylcobinamide-phosphate guanylyltransferase/adenosylcobinamide kinase [Frankia sp. EI5c]|uniref:bifunctional adenosylcobinamide kinase/adenosylcobinamide-phosphate guanylyltransferase n=1 Tax=Frankia sp. EI5c TaxID=683316 RepID=UPI0007C373CE|nr:bifunctional adenosylcobinamide kinase/adenosylcobinamide-phosphate guanylyltransferase [Frankia sp. EI5c]OAA28318.1 adenosylcobinamide-phosphate guanylyltransferase/adenosylcobinamide kinase [Frankia sp. EI5c]
MQLTLLGTGSADGWPNPWCECASCEWARAHEPRGQTAVLVDGRLLIDFGPDVPRAAARFGVSLAGLRHVLVGHAHPDHLGPEALMWRSWSTVAAEPLDVVAPPAALDVCRAFLRRWEGREPGGGESPLRLLPATAGEPIALGGPGDGEPGYLVRPVAARHGDAGIGPAVLYDLTAPDGARLLYGCDTAAPLPAPTLAALAGRAFDVVLLEENNGDRPGFGEHLDLPSFARLLTELRALGAVTASTTVLAVHLSHRNPPGDELARRLRDLGAQAPPDGTVLDVTPGGRTEPGAAPRAPGPTPPAPAPPPAPPPRRTLVTGGTRSGKSAQAEHRLLAEPDVVYVATGYPADGSDPDWSARVEAHRDRRPAGWSTVETLDLEPLLRTPGPPVLIDSISLWVAARLDEPDFEQSVHRLVEAWRGARRRVVAVTDEAGSGPVAPTPVGRRFVDRLGEVNARLAAESDEVWLSVAGLPLRLRPQS